MKTKRIAYIKIYESVSYVKGPIPIDEVSDLLSFHPNNYQFSDKYRTMIKGPDGKEKRLWDGKLRLFSKRYGSLPTGLVTILIKFLKSKGYEIKIDRGYKRVEVEYDPSKEFPITRPYQIDAIKAALLKRRGIIKMPTGSGKTLVAAGIIKQIGKPAVLLTHTKEILHQTTKSFRKDLKGEFVGIIGDSLREMSFLDVVSIPTLTRNPSLLHRLKEKKVLIVDEVHHSKAKTWYALIQQIKAQFKIGLSATPDLVLEKMLLEASIGPIIHEVPPDVLIKEGFLSKPHIYMIKNEGEKLDPELEYSTAYAQGIAFNIQRHKLIKNVLEKLKKLKLTPTLILVNRVTHARSLASIVKAPFLEGLDSSITRNRKVKEMEDGKLPFLIATPIFGEGVDIPHIRSLVLAGCSKSPLKLIQEIGRSMRVIPGKKSSVVVVDIHDSTHKYLVRSSNVRKKTYKSLGYPLHLIRPEEIDFIKAPEEV